ncbi:MAG: outer membrane beta-barrel protein [Prolixibacteraceae bacterium]|nr:outer membrane beta-barrel protein [Prolixibacteraceae bacterium]
MTRSIVLLVLLILTQLGFAQNFRLGFQASPHMSWMNSSKKNIVNNELRPGIKYGLQADIFLAGFPRYSLNTGLFVANHSFSAHYQVEEDFFINDVTFSEPVTLTYQLNYLEIPLNIKLKSDQFYRFTFYGQFGLTNLINLSATASSGDERFSGDNINQGMNNRVIKPYNLSMIMGGGAEYDVGGNTALHLGLQYSNGLIDVTTIRNLDEKTVFNSLRLVLGVMF